MKTIYTSPCPKEAPLTHHSPFIATRARLYIQSQTMEEYT